MCQVAQLRLNCAIVSKLLIIAEKFYHNCEIIMPAFATENQRPRQGVKMTKFDNCVVVPIS